MSKINCPLFEVICKSILRIHEYVESVIEKGKQ